MAKQSTGFITTIPNFSDVIDILAELGVNWNPIDSTLSIANLQARRTVAEAVMNTYKTAFEFDKIKTSERETAYAPLNAVVRRILAAAVACKMDAATVEDIMTYKDLIDGSNISKLAARKEAKTKKAAEKTLKLTGLMPETPEAATEDDKRTVSRLAYNLRYDNFENLITLLTTAGTYKTNVADLSIAALNALLDRLAAANKATNDADKALSNAADARNAALCNKTDSICSVVADIKTELISMETKSGATYKKVVEIKFMPFDR